MAELANNPWVLLGLIALVVLVMGWPFIDDPSRVVPAFDTAYYQWRAEYLMHAEPGALVELRGPPAPWRPATAWPRRRWAR